MEVAERFAAGKVARFEAYWRGRADAAGDTVLARAIDGLTGHEPRSTPPLILPVRLDEPRPCPGGADPAAARAHHDMRIAAMAYTMRLAFLPQSRP
jgi:hypothetical protein